MVDFVSIVELGQDLVGIAQQNYSQDFMEGDSIEYTSIVSSGNSTTYPRVIQLNIYGQNLEGEEIVNFFAISFTNNCSAYPVFEDGFMLGWTTVVSSERILLKSWWDTSWSNLFHAPTDGS